MTKRTIFNQIVRLNSLYLKGKIDDDFYDILRDKLIRYMINL